MKLFWFMDASIKKYLLDILESVDWIETYFSHCVDFNDYDINVMLQDAVERNLEIIGEAMSKILAHNPQSTMLSSPRL